MLVELFNAVLLFFLLLQWLLETQNAQVFFVKSIIFLRLPPVDATAKDLAFSVLRGRLRPILFVFGRDRATGNFFQRLHLIQLDLLILCMKLFDATLLYVNVSFLEYKSRLRWCHPSFNLLQSIRMKSLLMLSPPKRLIVLFCAITAC